MSLSILTRKDPWTLNDGAETSTQVCQSPEALDHLAQVCISHCSLAELKARPTAGTKCRTREQRDSKLSPVPKGQPKGPGMRAGLQDEELG